MTPSAAGGRLSGRISAFDAHVGLGVVEAQNPGEGPYPFHCTQIADGSRSIAVGADVTFSLVCAHHGRIEAVELTELPSPD